MSDQPNQNNLRTLRVDLFEGDLDEQQTQELRGLLRAIRQNGSCGFTCV